MKHTKRILRPIAKEFQIQRCGFENDAPDDFVKSQWQYRTKSLIYLIYRTCMALFFIAVVIESMVDHVLDGYYFIYLTNWGILMCMLTNTLGATLVAMWYFHPEYADRISDSKSMPYAFKVYWAMHIITLITSIAISIVYWTFLYKNEPVLKITSVLTHGFNSICMFMDLLIVAYPVRLLHIFLPMSFGITYAIFSAIYYYCGGLDIHGNHYIYSILDWSKIESAMITVAGVIILCCIIYMIIFAVFKLRVFIYKRFYMTTLILPTTQQTPPIVTHPANGISMVLSDFGIQNKGFTSSQEKIS